MSDFTSLLIQHLSSICNLDSQQLDQLEHHYRLLQKWNRKINLTSLKSLEEIVLRHYCESLALGAKLPNNPVTVADIGSGAGFPGFPMAIMRPDCRFALVESNTRKSVFLIEASRDIPNIQIVNQRAESLSSRYDWIVTRAVQWRQLIPLVLKLARHVGFLISESDAEELQHRSKISWSEPIRLPWGQRRMILIGDVPRGTMIVCESSHPCLK